MKNISLYCKTNGHNKEYHLQLEKSGSEWIVNFQYGAIGSSLRPGTKTPTPVSEEEANKIFDKLVKEKINKGYIESEESKESGFSGPTIQSKEVILLPQLLNVIEESEVQKYINDDEWVGQRKFDGERRMAIVSDKIIGLNKKGQPVQLPDSIIVSLVNVTKEGCTLDGEIIKETLHVFDLLSYNGKDLKNLPYLERIKLLNTLVLDFGMNIEVVKTAYTKEDKQKIYDELKATNAEGMVFKLKSGKYVAGRPNSGGEQLKRKFQKTGTFIVADITKGKRSVGLNMINDAGEIVKLGKVTIPPNKSIPNVGAFVEVQYLYAFKGEGGCIFQPVFLNERNDCDMTDINMSQLVYKAD